LPARNTAYVASQTSGETKIVNPLVGMAEMRTKIPVKIHANRLASWAFLVRRLRLVLFSITELFHEHDLVSCVIG
jgi:hypothetical protein